tara:strand:+ start:4999 stop:6006 length:1008 start_codon:yes stop_codon:yes gene_type:complete
MTETTPDTTIANQTTPDPGAGLVGQQTGTESSLSNYVGPYVTDMLGKGEALADMPYEAYTGPLTAGESDLQTDAFTGLANLTVPTDDMGGFTPGSFTDEGVAAKFMNPYIMAALQPQIDEAKRQANIQRIEDAGRLTRAGAFGGSRQAVMEAEGARGLLDRLAGITGAGYRDAFDKAMGQFNVEQGREQTAQDALNEFGLTALGAQLKAGDIQRAIDAEGIAADKTQFEEERDYPYKQIQYMQSLLQGLPLAAQQYTYAQPSALSELLGGTSGIMTLYNSLFGTGADGSGFDLGALLGLTTPESDVEDISEDVNEVLKTDDTTKDDTTEDEFIVG